VPRPLRRPATGGNWGIPNSRAPTRAYRGSCCGLVPAQGGAGAGPAAQLGAPTLSAVAPFSRAIQGRPCEGASDPRCPSLLPCGESRLGPARNLASKESRLRVTTLAARGGTPVGCVGSVGGAPKARDVGPDARPAELACGSLDGPSPPKRDSPAPRASPRASGGDAGTRLWATSERAQQRRLAHAAPTRRARGFRDPDCVGPPARWPLRMEAQNRVRRPAFEAVADPRAQLHASSTTAASEALLPNAAREVR
jgi:hypothetical protein